MKRLGPLALLSAAMLFCTDRLLADRWTHLLPFENVNCLVYDDSTKILWLGTGFHGVYRFDGRGFENFRPVSAEGSIDDAVTALALDRRRNALWVGTTVGLFLFHFETKTWEHFQRGRGLSENRILSLYLDAKGNIWYGSMSGAGESGGAGKRDPTGTWFKYTRAGSFKWTKTGSTFSWLPDTTCTRIPDAYRIDCIAQDHEGNLLFGTDGGGLYILRPDCTWEVCISHPNAATIKAITIDREGKKWLGTLQGVYVLDHCNSQTQVTSFTRAQTRGGLVQDTVNAIWIEPYAHGEVKWFATEGGVSALDSTNKMWKSFTVENGLGANIVRDVVGDDDGNLWFGLQQFRGLSKLDNKWSELKTTDGLSNNFTRAVAKDWRGRLWVGTDERGNVQVLDNGNWRLLRLNEGGCLNAPLVRGFLPVNREMWVATEGCGLFRISDNLAILQKFRLNDPPEFPEHVLAIAMRNDTLWAGTTEGLVRLVKRNQNFAYDTTFTSTLPSLPVFALAHDQQGRLWIGTTRGLVRHEGRNWQTVEIPVFAKTPIITALAFDARGTLWTGTHLGIARLDTNAVWTSFTIAEGLPDSLINTLAIAPDGVVWCGTTHGAAAFFQNRWIAYRARDGLSADFIYGLAFGPSEVVWFATWGGGIARYRRTEVSPQTYFVDKFDIITETNVTFHFAGFDLNTPADLLRYQYELDNPLTANSKITPFDNVELSIPEDGFHTFRVRALDKDGNADPSEAKFDFHLIRPRQGGEAEIVDIDRVREFGSLWLYVPPNALEEGAVIRATPLKFNAEDGLPPGFTGIAYALGPQAAVINARKPLSVRISYGDSIAQTFNEQKLALYRLEQGWQRLGGTVEAEGHAIATTLTQLDTIALFADMLPRAETMAKAGLGSLAVQPRVFSPAGNGFLETVSISFDLDAPGEVTAKVYNRAGRLVRVLCENRPMTNGRQVVTWNGRNHDDAEICPTGLYIVAVEAHGEMAAKPVMVLNR